ncbi:MAG: hypothetical protein Q8M80_02935 [Hydrogenophaga sp.]|uniref:hypothetical protein n=1 Tax=Hydrogenophaga sp. TaxID=1904254 RepID=UPI0027238E70|nr:hypothetical protein [Hydrogenophaga sp.]MDO9505826.1 hypothetical protein [Hydrogenophaga sp.]MDP3203002.1 hypothetical protein [Hydrogenophaga sp.]MDP3625854.1 hypothetical protein [Hydrogenophaga sp.]
MTLLRTFFLCSVIASVIGVLGGCASLLPTSRTDVASRWTSYEDAERALATIQAFKASRDDVHRQGLDPRLGPGITVLHFADVLQRFTAVVQSRPDHVDPGVNACLQAGQRCSGYAISVKKLGRQRVGNFWADSLNFRRETITTGWSADVLLVFVDDILVYKLMGGQPTIREVDVQRNPLGPLQGWGQQLAR